MTAKKPKVRMHARIERTWTDHPLATIGAVVGAVAAMVTIIVTVVPFITGYIKSFETVESAAHREATIRAIIVSHQANDIRTNAWGALQGLKNEVNTMRNRVNDCNIKLDKKDRMTTLERSVCLQYQQDYDDAARRFEDARKAAVDTTKER